MLTLYLRLAKMIVALAWMCAAGLSVYAYRTDRAVFSNRLRREIVLANGTHRAVEHGEINGLAAHADGANVRLRRITADRWRGSIAITATSMTYRIDRSDGLKCYYEDNGSPGIDLFQSYGEPIVRGFYRFPLSRDRAVDWDIDPQLPPPDYHLHYAFVRTNDPYRTGWDLELRVPFWIVWTTLSLPLLCYMGAKGYQLGRRRKCRAWRRCEHCNYDLRASTDRCPECGHPIPAATTATTPPAQRLAAHPPSAEK